MFIILEYLEVIQSFRMSANFRNVDGVLKKSGFDKYQANKFDPL